jgi:hypothetical protein
VLPFPYRQFKVLEESYLSQLLNNMSRSHKNVSAHTEHLPLRYKDLQLNFQSLRGVINFKAATWTRRATLYFSPTQTSKQVRNYRRINFLYNTRHLYRGSGLKFCMLKIGGSFQCSVCKHEGIKMYKLYRVNQKEGRAA